MLLLTMMALPGLVCWHCHFDDIGEWLEWSEAKNGLKHFLKYFIGCYQRETTLNVTWTNRHKHTHAKLYPGQTCGHVHYDGPILHSWWWPLLLVWFIITKWRLLLLLWFLFAKLWPSLSFYVAQVMRFLFYFCLLCFDIYHHIFHIKQCHPKLGPADYCVSFAGFLLS